MSSSTHNVNITKELIRCKVNPNYFIENYVRIEEPGSTIQIKPYKKQKEFVKSLMNDHYVITLKSRQIGISTITQAFAVYITTFYSNITVGIISRDRDESTDFARKCRIIYDDLPQWMKLKYIKKTEQTYELENHSRIISSTVNQANPTSVFRGKTITFLIIDEAAFVRNIQIAFTGIAPAVIKAHQVAREKNIPHGIAILSTPNKTYGIGQWFYDTWTKSISGQSIFNPMRIHYSEAPFADDEWLAQQKKLILSIGNEDDIEQELELKFISGDDTFLNREVFNKLQNLINMETNVIREEEKTYTRKNGFGKGTWEYYSNLNPDKIYYVGVDVATSYGACNSVIEVTDEYLRQCAEFVGDFRIIDLENEIIEFMTTHKNAFLIIEANSYAAELVERLEENEIISNRMFYRKKYNKEKTKIIELNPGVITDNKTKPKMMSSLYNIVTEDTTRIKSKSLASELMALKKDNTSKRLTDRLMAYSFICYVHTYFREDLPTTKSSVTSNDKKILNDIFSNDNTNGNKNKLFDINKITSNIKNELKHKIIEEMSEDDFFSYVTQDNTAIDDYYNNLIKVKSLNDF